MQRALIVVGFQPEKLKLIKRDADRLETWICATQDDYDYTISIVRQEGNRNMMRTDSEIIDRNIQNYYPFQVDKEIEVYGYDVDTNQFRRDVEYSIVGVSTSASVLCIAMSMYSAGLNVKVLENHCYDRKGLHREGIKIMNAYMKDCVIK